MEFLQPQSWSQYVAPKRRRKSINLQDNKTKIILIRERISEAVSRPYLSRRRDNYEIKNFQSNFDEGAILLGCDAVSTVKFFAASRRSEAPPSLTDCLKIKMEALRSFNTVVTTFGSNRYNVQY